LGLNFTGKEGKDGIFVSATQGHKRAHSLFFMQHRLYMFVSM